MSGHQDSFVSVYSDARSEYTRQLCIFLTPSYFRWFIHLLEKARETTVNEPRKLLWQFQTYLNDIPEWNMEKLNTEIHGIQTSIGCDYLEDLLTAVFIAHTKVLTAIRLTSKQKRIQITVPKAEHFLFKVLCESSKLLWGSSYLFSENVSNIEKQKNYRQIEGLIVDGIHQAIRALVPVKSILKDFVNQEEADDAETEADTEAVHEHEHEHEQEHENIENKEVEKKLEKDLEVGCEKPEEAAAAEVAAPAAETIEHLPTEPQQDIAPLEPIPIDTAMELQTPIESSTAPVVEEPIAVPDPVVAEAKYNPIINISENPKGVSFTNYVTVFSPSNPDNSEIIRDSDAVSDDGTNSLSLDFLDDTPQKLDLNDVEDLNGDDRLPMNSDDYEVLG